MAPELLIEASLVVDGWRVRSEYPFRGFLDTSSTLASSPETGGKRKPSGLRDPKKWKGLERIGSRMALIGITDMS